MGRVASQLDNVLLPYGGQVMSLSFGAGLGTFCIPLFVQQQAAVAAAAAAEASGSGAP